MPRIKDPALLRLLHLEYDECCCCGSTASMHIHHVIYKSHQGDDVRGNLVPMCEPCHTKYHSRDHHVMHALWQYIVLARPDVIAYLEFKLGPEPTAVWGQRHGG